MFEIEFESDELNAASQWHGGQSSMLYAISSTGSLKLGTIRPRKECEGERCDRLEGCAACNGSRRVAMTDAEWFVYIAEKLSSEASEAADDCERRVSEGDDDNDELDEHSVMLRSIETKCDLAIRALVLEVSP